MSPNPLTDLHSPAQTVALSEAYEMLQQIAARTPPDSEPTEPDDEAADEAA